jgi:hypothetical protein
MSTTTTRKSAVAAQRRVILDHSGEPAQPTSGNGQAKAERPKPIDEVRLGRVKAAIWQNAVQTPDGREFVRYGVTFEKLYLNKDGQWRGTGSFAKDDLLLLAKVTSTAFDRITEMQMERPL